MILPDVAALSDDQCRQLRSFVRAGGGLVATSETSLFDERGARRDNFGLADLFGVDAAGERERRIKNSYTRIEPGRCPPDAAVLLRGFEEAERMIGPTHRVPITASPWPVSPFTLVPPYPDLPMEEVYPRTTRTDEPEVILSVVGAGRVAYLPGDYDRTFWEVLAPDHGRLLANVGQWAAREEAPVVVEGPGLLDVVPWLESNALTVYLVNMTNPTAMRGHFRDLIEVGPHEVTIRLPDGFLPGTTRLLRRDTVLKTSIDAGKLRLTVPSILDFEVIAIDRNDSE